MPAVDQAAILPLMLTCDTYVDDDQGGEPIAGVNFRR